eukprot:NODE_4496_length_656_cov_14.530478_g3845_i0.p1 GENE.NODE_4496_length_656_cov_14.530478_g3845_i0~~NODE_4496_length_656_cov_14.530478_g3845_i0.p1  ORF type:complete len:194 (-),score=3.97 NODE_4496_length_656_cov_14.530478_g3845_i0:17-598(-)
MFRTVTCYLLATWAYKQMPGLQKAPITSMCIATSQLLYALMSYEEPCATLPGSYLRFLRWQSGATVSTISQFNEEMKAQQPNLSVRDTVFRGQGALGVATYIVEHMKMRSVPFYCKLYGIRVLYQLMMRQMPRLSIFVELLRSSVFLTSYCCSSWLTVTAHNTSTRRAPVSPSCPPQPTCLLPLPGYHGFVSQ